MGCVPTKPMLLKSTPKNQPKKQKKKNAKSNFCKLVFGVNPVKRKREPSMRSKKQQHFQGSNSNKNMFIKPPVRRQSVLMQIISVFEQKLNGLKENEKEGDELYEDTTENDQSAFSIDSCSENTRMNRMNNKNGDNNNNDSIVEDDQISSQYSPTSSQ